MRASAEISPVRLGRADALAIGALTACAAALYGATLCRSLYFYDSAEYATAAHQLGVPHPPGYPLYTLLAHLFVRAAPGSPALAVNVLSAFGATVAVGLCYAVARALGARPAGAAFAAALLATAQSFWFNATVAEVYAPGLCGSLLVLWLLLQKPTGPRGERLGRVSPDQKLSSFQTASGDPRLAGCASSRPASAAWRKSYEIFAAASRRASPGLHKLLFPSGLGPEPRPELRSDSSAAQGLHRLARFPPGGTSGRRVIGAAAVAGLCLGLHYSLATLGLGFAWLALAELSWERRPLRVLGGALACAAAAVASFGLNVGWLALRASVPVTPNHAYPPSTARLLWLVSGGNYRGWFTADASFFERALALSRILGEELSPAGIVLAGLGLWVLSRRSRTTAIGLALGLAGNLGFFWRYSVHDLEVFLLPSVALLCALAGLGLQAVLEWLVTAGRHAPPQHAGELRSRSRLSRESRSPTHRLQPARPETGWRSPWRFALLLALVLIGARVLGQYAARDLTQFRDAEDYGERLCAQLPYGAVILNYTTPDEWKYDAVFGLYFQQVLGRRRDVAVARNAGRPVLDRLLAEGRPTYLYAPVAHVLREYSAAPEGLLLRVSARR